MGGAPSAAAARIATTRTSRRTATPTNATGTAAPTATASIERTTATVSAAVGVTGRQMVAGGKIGKIATGTGVARATARATATATATATVIVSATVSASVAGAVRLTARRAADHVTALARQAAHTSADPPRADPAPGRAALADEISLTRPGDQDGTTPDPEPDLPCCAHHE